MKKETSSIREALKEICAMPTKELFEKLGGNTKENKFIYKDNGSSVLVVAHLDTVFDNNQTIQSIWGESKDGRYIVSPALDDRLGVWIIEKILPNIGITADVLYTLDEETGSSTAYDFVLNHLYEDQKPTRWNWIAEFDRRNENVVTYEYREKLWNDAIRGVGFNIQQGMFSDISFMEDLKICAMNVGIGYSDEHSIGCHADLQIITRQLKKFKTFYDYYKSVLFSHEQTFPHMYGGGFRRGNYYKDIFDDENDVNFDYYYNRNNKSKYNSKSTVRYLNSGNKGNKKG